MLKIDFSQRRLFNLTQAKVHRWMALDAENNQHRARKSLDAHPSVSLSSRNAKDVELVRTWWRRRDAVLEYDGIAEKYVLRPKKASMVNRGGQRIARERTCEL